MIHLLGDSIFRGAALKRYADTFTPEQIAAEPMWPFVAPANTMNLLWGAELVRFAGYVMLPDGVEKTVRFLRTMIEQGVVAPGDSVILLDAGRHECNPDQREANWRLLRAAATGEPRARLIICNTFDNFGSFPPPNRVAFGYGVDFGGRTMNDATCAAATEPPDTATEFLDLATPIQTFQTDMVACDLTAYRPDRIHLNFLGNLAMCALLCRAVDPTRPLHAKVFRRLAREHPGRLGATRPREARVAIERALSE